MVTLNKIIYKSPSGHPEQKYLENLHLVTMNTSKFPAGHPEQKYQEISILSP